MANKKAAWSFLARPGGMCGARGRDREGVRRDLGWTFDDDRFGFIELARTWIWNLARGATYGGAAERCARSAGPYQAGQ